MYHYSVYIHIQILFFLIPPFPIPSTPFGKKHHFQEAVDIVLKFPNPSDAADALVKDRLSFRSEELIEIWTLLLF